jgi:putative transcriptional regulator
MTPNHHPDPATMIAYAAGTLANAISCVVACHITLCRECADHARWLGVLGGVMLEEIAPTPADEAFAERAVAQWKSGALPALEPAAKPDPTPDVDDPVLPRPLARYLGMGARQIPWRTVVKGVRQHWVKLPKGAGQIRLLRLTPGKVLLEHTHTGMELTLVLQGVYGDHTGEYLRGDVIEWTEGTLHQPHAAGDQDCICLVASESTPHFSRLIARLVRPILGF